ncbi:hypothetical protein JMJ35_007225 [Cladonia borealis]|uniref:Heterokaryon incompatibility domain-containing protein n=1 Tax=Cladonia borealis TaxID=184061 RepID=A0AA39V078_9LECA|nr:hypothetical protein JMJ35_007225 [Cladonia borealis]
MDHMNKPKNAIHGHIEVPYHADRSDGRWFSTFLVDKEFLTQDIFLLLWQHGTADTDEHFLSIVQNWLFFGVLTEVLQLNPSEPVFKMRKEDGREVVCTKGLPRVCNDFRATVPAWQESEDRERVQKVINMAQTVVDALCLRRNWTYDRQVLILSIVLLYNLIRDFWGLNFSSSIRGYLGFLETRMIDDGWCKSDIEKLRYSLEPERFYFVAQMDPPTPFQDHQGCPHNRCLLRQVELLNYKTKHIDEGCKCTHVTASEVEMFSILKSGFIPLILWSSDSPMKIVSSQYYANYVALSHVWSDRLGNPTANSLPCCQLELLSRLVNSLQDNDNDTIVPFWMDTICCPVTNQEARSLAIISMHKTYSEASKVLVLDAYLRRTEMKGLADREILLRIICSPWTCRLWTFQEGVLAKELLFQFADGPLDFNLIAARFSRDAEFLGGDRIRGICALLRGQAVLHGAPYEVLGITPITSYREVGYSLVRALKSLSTSLVYRDTSVASDEALCIGTIIGMDIEAVTRAPRLERMITFWSLQDRLSAAICLWNGPRLTEPPGYRWAPSSFVSQTQCTFGRPDSRFDYVEAKVTPSGLLFDSPCIFLHAWKRALATVFYLRQDRERCLVVEFYPVRASQKVNMSGQMINQRPDSESLDFAILVQPPFEFDSDEPPPSPQDRAEGILVSIEGQEDGVFQARLEGDVSIAPAGHPSVVTLGFSTQLLEQVLEAHTEEHDPTTASIQVVPLKRTSTELPASLSELIGDSPEEHQLRADFSSFTQSSQEVPHQLKPSGHDLGDGSDLPDVSSLQISKSGTASAEKVSEGSIELQDAESAAQSQDYTSRPRNQEVERENEVDDSVIKIAVFRGLGRTTSVFSEETFLMFDGIAISPSQTWCID